MKKNLAGLIKVKTLVTLAVIAVFSALSLRGAITPDNVMIVVTTVIAFYFGTQYESGRGPEPARTERRGVRNDDE